MGPFEIHRDSEWTKPADERQPQDGAQTLPKAFPNAVGAAFEAWPEYGVPEKPERAPLLALDRWEPALGLDSPVTTGAGDSAVHTGMLGEGVHTLRLPELLRPPPSPPRPGSHLFYFSPILTRYHMSPS